MAKYAKHRLQKPATHAAPRLAAGEIEWSVRMDRGLVFAGNRYSR